MLADFGVLSTNSKVPIRCFATCCLLRGITTRLQRHYPLKVCAAIGEAQSLSRQRQQELRDGSALAQAKNMTPAECFEHGPNPDSRQKAV